MKKLLIINTVIILLLFIAANLPDYYSNNQLSNSLIDSFIHFEWLIFSGILMAGVLLASFLGCIPFKKIPYKHRFLRVNIFIDIVFLLFLAYTGALAMLDAKKEMDVLLVEYRIKAESDIKNGLITYETAGLPWLLDSAAEARDKKVDSIMLTYGIARRNAGCIVSGPLLRAQSYYEQLTASYLDQRNGPAWEHRMNRQIDKVRIE
ncbi:FEKKY domain-containing protein [Dyadobacter psychrotolerans]|uniref:Uncharacterized protein n=1 Tax=Dyadobacter psychrotolerans TaxID=2541721 RepID=A0A4R5DKR9_9BACT|nr:hypothetical protein [Dyadobacter psychrotolerans]TDE14792.1 hypothetical protein E0F88_16530 [Dyadobacter psychrotolerans]